jgi:hypothetical protein
VISLALALALAPAPVYVETTPGPDAETRSLQDQLMLRLLEEGYPLAPSPETATRTLRVEPTPEGIRVQAQGQDTRTFEVATGPVLPLEAVHRAMEALDEVTPRSEPTGVEPPRVAVHLGVAQAGTEPEALRRTLVQRLLARHSTVVPLDAAPDAVLCVQAYAEALELSRAADVDGCSDPARPAPKLVALEAAEPNAAALDASLDSLLVDPAERSPELPIEPIEPTGPTPAAGLAARRAPIEKERGVAVRLSARTGIYGRLSAADAAVGASLRVGGEPGIGGIFDVLMIPSSAPDISILETSVSGGLGYTLALSRSVALQMQGLGGVQVHRYRQRGAEPGNRVDWTAELPVGVSLRVARGLQIDLMVRAGRSGRAREHRVDDMVVWSRSAWRIGGSVGLSYGWRPR